MLVVSMACGSSAKTTEATGPGGDDASVSGDAGAGDAPVDAGPPQLARACSNTVGEVYAAPQNLPPMTDGARGDVVRCATDTTIDAASMASRLSTAKVAGVDATSGARTYRIAYRTWRANGSAGIGTARVYLPTAPRATPVPVAVAAHGTTGLADACAPSKYEALSDYLNLAWVAHGYALVAPDYAGLGTGSGARQGYGDGRDTAQSALDAARAIRKLVAAGALSSKIVLEGHSQGGGAVLSAQAAARTYGADGDVVGVIGYAPGWPVKASVDGMRDPGAATSYGGGLPAALASLFLDAWFFDYVGPSHEGDGFGASARAAIASDLGSQCILQLVQSIPQAAPTVGDLLDSSFRTAAIACADGASGCVEPAQSYWRFLQKNVMTADAAGGKVMVVQGLQDAVVLPQATACVVKKLGADGAAPQVCVDSSATHLDVVQRNSALALKWADAVVDGTTPPSCDSGGLPSCP